MKTLIGTITFLLVMASSAIAQLTVLPEEGKFLGYVSAPEAGKWIAMSAGEFMPVPLTVVDSGKAVLSQGPAGKYGIFFFPPGDGQPIVQVVELGKGDPEPDPKPDPQPTPGQRWALVIEESSQRTPQQATQYLLIL
jgi:hypothetical protein